MKLNICTSCGEFLTRKIEKCPKCGIEVQKKTSPVIIGGIIAVVIVVLLAASLVFL